MIGLVWSTVHTVLFFCVIVVNELAGFGLYAYHQSQDWKEEMKRWRIFIFVASADDVSNFKDNLKCIF